MKSVAAVAVIVAGLLLAAKGYGWVLVVALVVAFAIGGGLSRLSGSGHGTGSASSGRNSARWSTAVHEASHVVAVRHYGGSASARVSPDGRTGSYSGSMPDRADRVADAVVHLAGGIGQKRIVGRDGPSSSDIAQARAALRGTGVSMSEAKAQAAALVSQRRGQIIREAQRLGQV